MSRTIADLNIILIQVRETAKVALHEQTCFCERCGIDASSLKIHNVLDQPEIRWSDVANCDAVIIGGAAAHSVTQDDTFTEPLIDVVCRLVEEDRPLFGSCWGHQFIARALGGKVITDRDNEEVGTFEMCLTEEGHADELFEGFPTHFLTHIGHHDRISVMPDSAIELAYSKRCRNQIIRIKGKHVYGTQFHAEMSAARLIERLSFYRDSYLPCDEEFESLKQNPLPTPEADTILHRFLERIL